MQELVAVYQVAPAATRFFFAEVDRLQIEQAVN